jgi:[ribosomal protein S18]-alanine N-acetyltransferase
MHFTIRRAAATDLPALLALEQLFPGDRLDRRGFRYLLTRAHADLWVAAGEGMLLGNAVVLYRRNAPSARLYSLVVAPGARRQGVAHRLVRALERAAAERGVHRIHLEVRCDNTAAMRLYQKLGYQLSGRLPCFYEDGQDALRFERALPRDGSPNAPRDLAA